MKSRDMKRKKMARRARVARMGLGAMLLCLVLLTGLTAFAAAEQADLATAMLEALRGRTYLTYGSAGDCFAYSFCPDGRTLVYTSAGIDDYFLSTRRRERLTARGRYTNTCLRFTSQICR